MSNSEQQSENTKLWVTIQVVSLAVVFGVVWFMFLSEDEEQATQQEQTSANQEEVHYHAGFAVVKDGERVDFSKLKYMTITSCNDEQSSWLPMIKNVRAHGDSSETSDEKKKAYEANDVHLHDGIGDVVHVHTDGVTWHDFFHSLSYETNDFRKAVVNGGEKDVKNVLNREIKKYERVVFLEGEGEYSSDILKKVPSKERIIEVGKQSEKCN